MAENLPPESWSVNIPCRYFASGICREGERCKYLHEEGQGWTSVEGDVSNVVKHDSTNTSTVSTNMSNTSSPNSATSSESNSSVAASSSNSTPASSRTTATDGSTGSGAVICRFFQIGRCMYGSKCHYLHESVNTNNNLSSSLEEARSSNPVTSPTSSQCSESSNRPSSSASSSSSASLVAAVQDSEEQSVESETFKPKSSLRVPDAETWVNAPEFIPSSMLYPPSFETTVEESAPSEVINQGAGKTWAQIVNPAAGTGTGSGSGPGGGSGVPASDAKLCPYVEMGVCPYEESCTYLHGDICDLCGRACLHPSNEEQRKAHNDECIKEHERNMELAFAVARSRDKQCGVCFEVVVEKNPASEQRFGILPNCSHCFCLACIRKWRQAKQFENKIIRACPECRVTSDYVCPSMYWVDTKEEKEKLIVAYKDALSNKQCKYFKQGRGKCPFGNKCFYLHANPDGTKVDTGPPTRRHRQSANGDIDVLPQLFLWDFLDERDNRWMYSLDDLEDLVAILADSEDSELSDLELF